MKLLKCFAISIMGAAAGLMLYCGSFYLKSYRENQQEQSKYRQIQEECTERTKNIGKDTERKTQKKTVRRKK